MRRGLGWSLACAIGFLSLSQEILWMRLVTFVHQGIPQSFAFVLGVFLFGVASGATLGKRICERRPLSTEIAVGGYLVAGGVIDLLIPHIISSFAEDVSGIPLLMGGLIYITAALKAIAFPVAHHLGSDAIGSRVGRSVSVVYFLNIVGSTLGTLFAGYVLLEYVSVSSGFVLVGVLTLCMGGISLFRARQYPTWAVLVLGAFILGWMDWHDGRFITATGNHGFGKIKHIFENRHGVIHVVDGGVKGDIVYGGNVYDGRTNIDLRINSNRIDRVYLLPALHPEPKKILVIGLSSGAWVRVLSSIPSLEQMDVVEINPGYLSLISKYPSLSPILSDERIKIHIDDGRRWLRRNSETKFDLIVMNTTFHWRANITNLLSKEFMSIAHSHLRPGGIIAFNSTGSPDSLVTAANVFPFAYRWFNFVYAAEHDFSIISPDSMNRLAALQLDGKGVFDLGLESDRKMLKNLLQQPFVSQEEVEQEAGRLLEVITDANMLTEFKYGKQMLFE